MQLGLINKLGSSSLQGALLNPFYLAFKDRVLADGGVIDRDSIINNYIRMAIRNGIYDDIELGIIGAYNLRTSGVDNYVQKAYSIDATPNDATQTTEASQPYLTGNIAPNEHWGMNNPNGDSRHVIHPEISFSSTDKWSVTIILNINDVAQVGNTYPISGGSSSLIGFENTNARIRTRNESGTILNASVSNRGVIGKLIGFTFTAEGNGTLNIYRNGAYIDDVAIATNYTFSRIFSNIGSYDGSINALFIRSQALSPTQVEAEAAYLQTIYPEIPTVNIGSSSIASSNIDVTESTNGTSITEAIDNADWATGAARWCYHNADSNIGSWAGKLYNKAARDIIIANPPSGYHVATEAELTALAALGGNALKHGGTDYWNTTGGTNSTGFTALGGSSRNADGTFNTIKDSACFWCADSDKVLKVYHNNNAAEVVAVASVNEGFSIRLIKD